MFEKKQDTADLITKAIEVLASRKDIGVVTHADLAAVLGMSPPEARYYQLVRKARELYRDNGGTWTREVPGLGYRFLTPEQALDDEQHTRRRRARKQLGIGEKAALSLPDATLTEHQRRKKHFALESHTRQKRAILADERLEKAISKSASDRPMRVIPPRLATGTDQS